MSSLPARKIRVLVVDDSSVVRRMVSQALSLQTDMEVSGCAENGRVALERVAAERPDVVLLDLEMPEMDGLTTLRELKKRYLGLPVVVFSTHTSLGANATVDALLAGADEYAVKPGNLSGGSMQWATTQSELLIKLRAATRRARKPEPVRPAELRSDASGLSVRRRVPVGAIAIGTSSGGPEALGILLPRLAGTLRVPLFIVQHMPRGFTGALATRLNEKSRLRVKEASQGQLVESGVAYLAPGDYHMQVSSRLGRVALQLDDGPLENGCRPSVDPLFRSAADVYGSSLLAIVLTGIGSDGLEGARKIASCGGHVWVQDQESSAVWGMPGAIARAGLARRTCALGALAGAIQNAIAEGLPMRGTGDGATR